MKLKNDKHERFCQEYLIDLNRTQAAIRAKYSEKTANEQGSRLLANVTKAAERAKYSKKTARSIGQRLLTNVDIQERIQELQKERSERTEITQDMVIRELAIVGFSDLANYIEIVEDTGAIRAKSFEEMPEGKSRALQSIKEDRVIKEDAKGEQVTVYDKISFKLHDKLKALELLGKHLGMFVEKFDVGDELKKLLIERVITKENPNGAKEG